MCNSRALSRRYSIWVWMSTHSIAPPTPPSINLKTWTIGSITRGKGRKYYVRTEYHQDLTRTPTAQRRMRPELETATSDHQRNNREFQDRIRLQLLNRTLSFFGNFHHARPHSRSKQQHPITMPAIAPLDSLKCFTLIPYVCTSGTMLSVVAAEEQSEVGSSQLSEKLE
jgi:hypothetical protein